MSVYSCDDVKAESVSCHCLQLLVNDSPLPLHKAATDVLMSHHH